MIMRTPSLTVVQLTFSESELEGELYVSKAGNDYHDYLDGLDSDHVRRISGAGRDTTGEEIVLSPRQDDLDIARLQHRGVSDIEE